MSEHICTWIKVSAVFWPGRPPQSSGLQHFEEERVRILELITLKTWPQGWTGEELRGDVLFDQVIADGVVQPVMFGGEL